MTDELENSQQNLTNGRKRPPVKTSFKPGYDPRRWLGGRGKKSPEQKEGEQILLAVIWEELSREFQVDGLKPLETPETIDAMRLAVRQAIKKDFKSIMERIAGKVTEVHDIKNSDGSLKPEEMKPSEIAARVAALLQGKDANSG